MTIRRYRRPLLAPRSSATAMIALVVAFAVAGCGAAATTSTGPDPIAIASVGPTLAPTPTAAAPTPSVATRTPLPTAGATPAPARTATPAPTTAATPAPPLRAFKMNLYRPGDFVAQYTFEWCVGASLQMALNMATDESHTSRKSQETLWEMAQARSSSPFGGANALGWTAALNDLGIGQYELISIPDYEDALRVAASAIRETKRPVGLVMWRGRHAWVMSGFEATGDPAIHDDVRITGIRVLDPLYPYGSKVWGKSPKPNALVSPATLAKQFVVRDHGRVDLGVPPGYLLVLPTSGIPATIAD